MSDLEQGERRRPRERIAARISRFVFLSCFASAFIVSWISIQSTHSSLRRSLDRSYPQALERAAERTRGWLRSGLAELEVRAESVPRGAAAGDGPEASGALERGLAGALEGSEHFQALAALGADGSPIAASGDLPADTWPLAPEGVGALVPTRPELRPTGSAHVAAVVPWPAGSRGGALVGVFRPDVMAALLTRERPGPEARMLLLDHAGAVAARTPPSAGEPRDPPSPMPLSHFPVAAAVGEYTGVAGDHVIGAAAPLGLFGWHLAIEAPFELAFGPLLSAAALILGIDLCVILLFSTLAFRRAAAIARPIESLCDGAQRIAAGQLEVDIPEVSSQDEIGTLTRAFRDMAQRLRDDRDRSQATQRSLVDRNQDLRQANEILSQLSITDGLTKLHNHRFFQDHLTREIKRVNRVEEPLSMLLVDIDDFKGLNDRFGHAAGDEVLVGLARIMDANVRESDLLARYGGEEFVVLLPDTDRQGAFYLAEKVRTAIAESSFILGDSLRPTRLTVSIGVAQYQGNRRKFFLNADRALYSAKAQGKNCVVVHDDE